MINIHPSLITKIGNLSDDLARLTPHDYLQQLPDKICEILSVDSCVLWKLDIKQEKFKVWYASQRVDDDYKKITLDLKHPTFKARYNFDTNSMIYVKDINNIGFRLIAEEEIKKRQWISLVSIPLKQGDRLIMLLDILIKKDNPQFDFTDKNHSILKILGSYVLSAFYKWESEERQKLQRLTDIMLEMTQLAKSDDVWELLREGISELISYDHIWLGQLDHTTGKLNLQAPLQEKKGQISVIEIDKIGIAGKAIKEAKPQLANNVHSSDWKNIYKKYYPNTRSELDIPIIASNIPIRKGTKIQLGSKCFGVINLESDQINAFSEDDQERLWLLARFAAIRLERIESDQKFRKLREIEQKIANAESYDTIINIIIQALTDTLKFTWVNISLINLEQTNIKTEYVSGIFLSPEKQEAFKNEVSHSLQADDIQSHIIRTKNIEVFDGFDKKMDKKIYKKYRHFLLIRGFIPMIEPSTDLVTGTIEVGYEKRYREYIYEEDIQIIKSLVDHAVNFLEKTKAGMIDRIMHEFKTPIGGIRSNIDFLLRHKLNETVTYIDKENKDYITIKLKDMGIDSEILAYQVEELEHFLGTANSRQLRLSRTNVLKDIIIKTINQMSPFLKDYDLPLHNITYHHDDIPRINLVTDKAKLNQVVYNLLVNAVKYAQEKPESLQKDPDKFEVVIEVEETGDSFIIKFKDRGIGIKEEDCDKIFDHGFRCREAMAMDVSGSGLGLSISRNIMRLLGGDLELVNNGQNGQPTEFHLTLPKNPPSKETRP